MLTRIYDTNQLAEYLNCSVPAIYSQLARKNYDAVPEPIKIGRKLAWTEKMIEDWIREKLNKK